MNTGTKIIFSRRISVKVTVLVLVILAAGIGVTILYYSVSQNNTLIESRIKMSLEESEVLYTAIKNNMLAGEAPVTVELFRDLSKMQGSIKLFRQGGVTAFSDNVTLETVNNNLKLRMFEPKTVFADREINTDENFKTAVNEIDDVFVKNFTRDKKELLIYKPLFNQPKCSSCHGLNHVIRGILTISTSVDEVFRESRVNTIISAVIYGAAVFILSVSIILFLRRFVIKRIFSIGAVVNRAGEGDFHTKIGVEDPDEIGALAQQINKMIDGLDERFKLSRFVSKSTLEHVMGTEEISLGGEKKIMTVLFSDIRGFTAFSEARDPADVMNTLNEAMKLQSGIVAEFGGDIDKFVGDEIMALFEGEDAPGRAAGCGLKIIAEMKEKFRDPEKEIRVGIGINTGEMISGNMGAGHRMDRTVIGDAVNLGAKLCSAAGSNVIIVSESTYERIKDSFRTREHRPIKIKGKANPVKIYTLRKAQ